MSLPPAVHAVEALNPEPPRRHTIADDAPVLVIQPKRGWIGVDWEEMGRFRELLFFLVWRDVKVKYKQAVLGAAWAILVPLASVMIYSVIGRFAGFADKTANGVPYMVFVYSGVLPWVFLQNAINGGGMSLVNNSALMSKVYLPRLFIPASTIGSALIDLVLSSIIFIGVLLFYGVTKGFVPSWQIVFLPFMLMLLVVAALGISFLLSAATIMYRDLRFIIPFITQLGIWLTFVAIPQTILVKHDAAGNVTHDYRNWLAFNPLAGIIQGFRSCVLGEPWQWLQLASSVVCCSAILVFGLFYFKRVERRFADIA